MTDPSKLREDYQRGELLESTVPSDPFLLFKEWFQYAVETKQPEPNAMTLATSTPDGQPSARIVLLKEYDERGFVFYTNYHSHKGHEIDTNPHVALVFLWLGLERQIRIQGTATRISAPESDAYFASRPRKSRLGAHASPQSQIIESRDLLDERWQQMEQAFEGDVPRPEHWGGYRVEPTMIEFWQGRSSRLHDRIVYDRLGDDWQIKRLAP